MSCIELVGCTGAGKTTLAKSILLASQATAVKIILAEDFALSQVGLQQLKNSLIRQILVNLIALSAALFSWQRNRTFFRFVVNILDQLPLSFSEKLYIGRNFFKNLGLFEIARHTSTQQVVLLDEGPLHTAHYLFVHLACEPSKTDMDRFVELVPLADMIVYIRVGEPVLVERTLKRGHKRILSGTSSDIACFIHRAVTVFEQLVETPQVKPHLMIFDPTKELIFPSVSPTSFQIMLSEILKAGQSHLKSVSDFYPHAAS